MITYQKKLSFQTRGRGTANITRDIEQVISDSGIEQGLCHCFIQHTSASLVITENADPDVRHDLEYFFALQVKDGDPNYRHQDEGPDDMSAHIRTVLTQTSITLPVTAGKQAMGVWQGLFLWEHRSHPQQRHVLVTVQGE